MKVKRMGIFLEGVANFLQSSDFFSKQPTQLIAQLIIAANNCHISF
jgi:hypothetical protein